jgi:hypothetical protein
MIISSTHPGALTSFLTIFLLGILPARSSAAMDYAPGPAALSFALVAKIIVGGTVEIDPSTGKPLIDPSTGKPVPSLYSTGSKKFDRAGRVTSNTDAYAGKILGAKYGNAEFVADLQSAGVIVDTEKKGWGIFAVRNGDDYRVEARKQGKQTVYLGDYITVRTIPVASNYNRTRTTTYKTSQPDVTTGRGTFSQGGVVRVDFEELSDALGPLIPEFSLDGSMLASGAEFRWYPDPLKKSEQAFIDLRASVRMNGLVGAYQPAADDESGNPPLFVTGSASLGPEKAAPIP